MLVQNTNQFSGSKQQDYIYPSIILPQSEKRYIIKGELPQQLFVENKEVINQARVITNLPQSPQKQYSDRDLLLSAGQQNQYQELTLSDSKGTNPVYEGTAQSEMMSAEKSYADAQSKIMRIKYLELENRIKLQKIENERLTRFLDEQTNEVQRLQESVLKSQRKYIEENQKQVQQISSLLDQNKELEETVAALSQHLVRMSDDKKKVVEQLENELNGLHQEFKAHKLRDISEQEHLSQFMRKEADSKIKEIQQQLDWSQQQVSQLNEQNFEIRKQNTELEHKLNIMIEENYSLTSHIQDYQQGVKMRENSLLEQSKSIQIDLKDQKRQYEKKLEEQKADFVKMMNEQVNQLSVQIGEREKQIQNLKEEVSRIRQQEENHRKQSGQSYQVSIQEAQNQILHLIEEKGQSDEQAQNLKLVIDQLENEVVQSSKQLIKREQAQTLEREKYEQQLQQQKQISVNFERQIQINQQEQQSLRSKLNQILNENEAIILKVNQLEHENSMLRQQGQKILEDFQIKIDGIKGELESEKDNLAQQMIEQFNEDQRKQNKNSANLQQKLNESNQVKKYLEGQIKKLKEAEKLSGEKINSLVLLNDQCQQEREKQIQLAQKSKREADASAKRLQTVENNYQLELESLQEKLSHFQQYDELLKAEQEKVKVQAQQILILQDEINASSEQIIKLEKNNKELLDQNKNIQHQFKNQNEIVTKQRLALENQELQMKDRNEGALRQLKQNEVEYKAKIEMLSVSYEELIQKYNNLLKKNRLKLLKCTSISGDIQAEDETIINQFQFTKAEFYNTENFFTQSHTSLKTPYITANNSTGMKWNPNQTQQKLTRPQSSTKPK